MRNAEWLQPASSFRIPNSQFRISYEAKDFAFTLVELLVIIGIMGIILATSVPALSRYANDAKLKAATREVIGLLSLARSSAISSRTPKTLVVNPQAHELRLEEPRQGEEPKIVRLASSVALTILQGQSETPATSLVFKPTGAVEGPSVSLILSNGKRSQTITVTSMTGAVTVQ